MTGNTGDDVEGGLDAVEVDLDGSRDALASEFNTGDGQRSAEDEGSAASGGEVEDGVLAALVASTSGPGDLLFGDGVVDGDTSFDAVSDGDGGFGVDLLGVELGDERVSLLLVFEGDFVASEALEGVEGGFDLLAGEFVGQGGLGAFLGLEDHLALQSGNLLDDEFEVGGDTLLVADGVDDDGAVGGGLELGFNLPDGGRELAGGGLLAFSGVLGEEVLGFLVVVLEEGHIVVVIVFEFVSV